MPVLPPPRLSPLRAWFALLALSFRRQLRARQMLFVAFGLLLIAVAMVGVRTARIGWNKTNERFVYRPKAPPRNSLTQFSDRPKFDAKTDRVITTYGAAVDSVATWSALSPAMPSVNSLTAALHGGLRGMLNHSGLHVFTRVMMFSLFLGFLLPVWCLSFATEPLGGERESRSLVWLLTRPIPRWSIYVGKYLALLPWALAFTVGGFGLMCWAAGEPGRKLFPLYWPAIAMGTLAFTSLFYLISAATRWPTVVGLVYCFFLETMLGDMPGLMKRISVSFYVRCMIFEAAQAFEVHPDKPSVYLPVSGTTAFLVLAAITVLGLVIGAIVFGRAEYRDDAS